MASDPRLFPLPQTTPVVSPDSDGDSEMRDADVGATKCASSSPSLSSSSTQSAPKPGAAGSVQHRAQRWKEYQERGGEWDYDRWSKSYDLNMVRAKQANAVADKYQQQLGWGRREVTVDIGEDETRRLDVADVANMRAVEVKSGYQTLNEDNRYEVERDKWLVEQGWDIEWHFEGTASTPLQEALKAANIKVTGLRS